MLLALVIGLITLSPLMFVAGSTLLELAQERWNRLPFDSTAWKASHTDPIRLRMGDDLLRRHALTGMTRDEVVSLLGTPPETDYFRGYQFVYWLGPERSWMSIDSEWLAIRFGKDGRVNRAEILRD